MTAFTESTVEDAALARLEAIGRRVAHGFDIAPDRSTAERANYGEIVLGARLRDALARLNSALPTDALNLAISRRRNSQVAAAAPCRASRHWALSARSRFA